MKELEAGVFWKAAKDKFFEKNAHYLRDEDRLKDLNYFIKLVANSEEGKTLSMDGILSRAQELEEGMFYAMGQIENHETEQVNEATKLPHGWQIIEGTKNNKP